jgi:hypothetical protein
VLRLERGKERLRFLCATLFLLSAARPVMVQEDWDMPNNVRVKRPTETRFSRSRSVEPAPPSIRRRKRTKDEGHGVARPKKIIKHALEFGELGLVAQNPMQVTEGGRKRE